MRRAVGACLALIAAFTASAALAAPEVAPLLQAARKADEARALSLLAAHADPRARESDGTTALHWAVYNREAKLVDALLKAGADVNARNDYGSTPLLEAAILADETLIGRLLRAGADPNLANDDGQSALLLVARNGNVAAARLLVSRGAGVNAREGWRQQTPLMWAAAQAQPDMVRFLIAHGAQVNARSQVNDWERQVTAEPRLQSRPAGGFTPLLYAARRGCLECARALVEGGADINLTDPQEVTPLLMATMNLNFDTAAYLLSRGADPNHWDATGQSPLYAAVDMNTVPSGGRADRPSSDKTTCLELIRRLLDAGANPNMQLKLMTPYRSLRDDRGADNMLTTGTTPLLRAAKAGDVPAMRLLLEHGAKVDLPNMNGITPLMAAAGNGSSSIDTRGRYKTTAQAIEAIELLVSAGANVNARDVRGQTALWGAARFGWNDVVTALVHQGARLDVKDSSGRTPVDAAMGVQEGTGRSGSEPQPQTVALLRELMAQASQ